MNFNFKNFDISFFFFLIIDSFVLTDAWLKNVDPRGKAFSSFLVLNHLSFMSQFFILF